MKLFKGRRRKQRSNVKVRTKQRSSLCGGVGCVQCGTRSNPCGCKVIGPTLGLVAFAVTAIVEWPVGAFVYVFKHVKGRRIMGHPARVVYPKVSKCIPI